MQMASVGVGKGHTVVCTCAGQLYSWGVGCQGQLGLTHEQVQASDAQLLASTKRADK